MGQRASRFQTEADKVIEKYDSDAEQIEENVDEHGIPLRVDDFGKENHWRYEDGYILKTSSQK